MATQTPERRTITVDEAAVLLGISRGTAYRSVQRGEIPSYRFGRRIVIARSTIENIIGREQPEPGALPVAE
ncbi:MAG: helix-turn-helix domain-containing protein [Acidimicrobiia bacterium]